MRKIICGVAKTGRTETFEDYYAPRVDELTVIGQSVYCMKADTSYYRKYKLGCCWKEGRLKSFYAPNKLLHPFVLLKWWWNIITHLEGRYDEYLGISHGFAMCGVILKKLGLVKRLTYYCLDWYQNDRVMAWFDRVNCRWADEVWDISPEINKQRRVPVKSKIVPMLYSPKVARYTEDIDWNRLVFVGSLSDNQGLEIVCQAMPLIRKKYPDAYFYVMGDGFYREHVVGPGVVRAGFIEKDSEVYDILSRSAIGVAMYTSGTNKNILCADVGKIKLYALCGLPVIATKYCQIPAGVVTAESPEAFAEGVDFLLSDRARLLEYKRRSYEWGKQFILSDEFIQSLQKAL